MPQKQTKDFVIKIYCANCGARLYKYQKAKSGALVKCYEDKILENYTKGDLKCPSCGEQFARSAKYHGRPAHKMISGKVTIKGHTGK